MMFYKVFEKKRTGSEGFEPSTVRLRAERSTRLSYEPNNAKALMGEYKVFDFLNLP